MAKIEISLLGRFEIRLEGEVIQGFDSLKVRALLAYLAAEANRSQARSTLAGLLWPDYPDPSAHTSLRQALYSLRRTLHDPPCLESDRQTITLIPGEACQVDVLDLERALAEFRGRRSAVDQLPAAVGGLQSAVAHYRGPFLEGFTLADSPEFEEWVLGRREHHSQQMLQALGILTDWYEKAAEYPQAEVYARRQLELEPWREEAHQQIMRLLARQGKRSQALAQYAACCRALESGLNVKPSPETIRLWESIREDAFRSAQAPGPAIAEAVPASRRHNLPFLLTSFVGRERETQAVLDLLKKYRLVTLSGPGGCGKTRLGLHVASQLVQVYQDGIWLVELAPLADPGHVTAAVARAIGLVESAQQPIHEKLLITLQESRMLLVLDNCEHLIEACAQLCTAILHACPGVVILATSREALGVNGERAFRVPSLPFPERDQTLDLADAKQYAALQLFEMRAEAAFPGFSLSSENLAAVTQLCARLDGIPLAIELAAARAGMLGIEQIAERWGKAWTCCARATPQPCRATRPCACAWSGATACFPAASRPC
jgi:DNA-binding SARP family transcriptional activator